MGHTVKPGLALLLPLLCLLASGCGEKVARLRLATTTSTRDSGLLDYLLPEFETKEGIEVQVVAVGTGQALALGERGDADVVLVHARSREDEFVAKGFGVDRRDVMWNDFVIAGPEDPAGVEGMTDSAAALERIRKVKARRDHDRRAPRRSERRVARPLPAADTPPPVLRPARRPVDADRRHRPARLRPALAARAPR